jgi:N-acetylmuramoyl-L-alanine amidase
MRGRRKSRILARTYGIAPGTAAAAGPLAALVACVACGRIAPAEPAAGAARDVARPAEGPPGETEPVTSRDTLVERSLRRIAVDAGHGGSDLGAQGVSGIPEKDVTLAAALTLADALRERDFEVVLVRESDVAVDLHRRTRIVNASGAGLLLSIHANSSPSQAARGVETYYLDLASDKAAERLAERENWTLGDGRGATTAPDDAESRQLDRLVLDLQQGGVAEQSRVLARSVHERMLGGLRDFYGRDAISDRGIRAAPFWVLADSEVPAVLLELGYLTHDVEERRLRTRPFRLRAAGALVAAVEDFVQRAAPRGPVAAGTTP